MKTTVDGVTIELTPKQMAMIEKAKAERDAVCKSFAAVFRHFGFKKCNTKDWEHPDRLCYEHENGWFAEIWQTSVRSFDCWMAGPGLPNFGFPGGDVYGSPDDVKNALTEALKKIGGVE